MKENPMKESEERALEELKSADDYFEAIGNILEFAGEMEGSERCIKQLDKINVLLCKSLLKKYKYLVGTSKKWTKKQSLFSRIKEHIADRREQKKEDTEFKNYPYSNISIQGNTTDNLDLNHDPKLNDDCGPSDNSKTYIDYDGSPIK